MPSYFCEILYGNVNLYVVTYICGLTVGHISNSVANSNFTQNDKLCLRDYDSQLCAKTSVFYENCMLVITSIRLDWPLIQLTV